MYERCISCEKAIAIKWGLYCIPCATEASKKVCPGCSHVKPIQWRNDLCIDCEVDQDHRCPKCRVYWTSFDYCPYCHQQRRKRICHSCQQHQDIYPGTFVCFDCYTVQAGNAVQV